MPSQSSPTRAALLESALRFRIFTPTMEMRFAGHPTLGGSFVALERGLVTPAQGRFVLEELIGEVPVRVEPTTPMRLWLTTLLDAPPQLVSAGNPNIYIPLRDPATVDRAWIDMSGVRRLHEGAASSDCVFVFAPTASGAYSRMFAPEHGVVEDPATGSATGPLYAYMKRYGLLARADGSPFFSEQGVKMGRRSLLHVDAHTHNGIDIIEVGGSVVSIAAGALHLK